MIPNSSAHPKIILEWKQNILKQDGFILVFTATHTKIGTQMKSQDGFWLLPSQEVFFSRWNDGYIMPATDI